MKTPSRRPALRAAALPVLVLATALTLTGCGGSGDAPQGQDSKTNAQAPGGSKAPADAGPVDQPLPLTAYMRGSAEDVKTIQRASELLISACMKRYGFDYAPKNAVEENKPARDSEYRMIPAAQAASYGYRSPKPATAGGDDTGDGKSGSEAEEAVRVGTGARTVAGQAVPEGGCKGEASRTMAKGLPQLPVPSPVDEAANTAAQKAQADNRLIAAIGKWSTCMKKSGFLFSQPQEPVARFSGKGSSGGDRPSDGSPMAAAATEEEKKVAVADSACNAEAGLEQAWYAVVKPLQQSEIDSRAEQFKTVEAWNKGYLANAQKALADH
ncbi:hypothetical protein [Streptomyces vietnamensis]|uniref:Lipoprotein n=1 Tax=Streptomyces vietnamensis TaxID=362257 RepID=A0A0B5ICH3_9ACTN|nr:hypothetical protein [Streptomyces vietnamensis]AJF66059.1 hypothetical protein SVTN_18340 [Streptomyces vietnamensis]